MDNYPSRSADRFIIRLPEGWRDIIKEEARKAHHSMNAEILNAIQTAMLGKGVQLDVPENGKGSR
ncbi:Arc family DNA-binding protein [Phaeobacter gallaeciensis]|uniref:Arc family DNA-binding protein n=1 Tax=Phaeobacter gallaeciensis TaxID=60890 RepID=UPI00237F9E7F|nr:Arc family DNA-binding protein [Phaeobacter gallaeciensis]MDE4303646.1 Arc family DNA-binding protein [Phaeobacter gallaeciensis]MDE4307873.1 Arc family DNA-binding protein [Phaeobacter gallaeciensis]MDE4312331.1 Arc family DNA-binding protein [Phaeobacter gallaeciensis]MDE4316802.1 Arc family DNA-binding protein [Phaeobacter gallaeciensis]MDE4321265.1 Arc family DNA-binding protein [Phaeobacter gallaeciensis]